MFQLLEISAASPLSSSKCANYKTYYSTHPENKGYVHSKNLLYKTCKNINLLTIIIKNNLRLSKRNNSETSDSVQKDPPTSKWV